MKKINIISKNYEINNVSDNKNMVKNRYFYIYNKLNNEKYYRFAICVSKKIGNAVRRNKIKRQIKDIIDKSNLVFSNAKDYVIIVRKEINNIDYQLMKESLINLISNIVD